MKVWNKAGQAIDFTNEWLGRVGWLLILYMMSFGLYDVIMRYLFNSPSLWIWLTLQFAMVALACVGGGYALLYGAFVKLDLIYGRLPPRVKAILDILTFVFTFLYCYVLIWKGIEAAHASFVMRQMTPTAIRLPLYHLKSLIPLGASALLLVAIKKFVLDVRIVIGKESG
ncbi:MAG: TRAP transporter small permease subunit [Dehalococcoidales bacterium]